MRCALKDHWLLSQWEIAGLGKKSRTRCLVFSFMDYTVVILVMHYGGHMLDL